MNPRFQLLLTFLILALATGGQAIRAQDLFADGFEPARPVDYQVNILPGTRMLTQSGASAQLSAEVRDFIGNPVEQAVRWRSTRPAMISVDDQGTITAQQALGSAQIIAEADGALPAAILVTVATPVAGALVVPDTAVAVAPQPVDSEAPYGVGYQYTVSLTGIAAPQVGNIVLGSGQLPVGGRVVAVSDNGAQVDLTLELVTLPQMFDQISIREKFDIKRLAMEYEVDVQSVFDYRRYDDGTLELSLKPSEQKGVQGTTAIIDQFIDCSESSLTNPLQIITISSGATLTYNPSLSVDLNYEPMVDEFSVEVAGGITALAELKPRTTAAFEGKLVCKFQVAAIPIPVGGPLALVFQGAVPVGAGVEVSGKVSLTEQLGYDFNVVGSHQVEAGLTCEPDCNLYGEFDVQYGASATPILPGTVDTLNDFQLDLNGFLFLFADLDFRNPIVTALSLKTLGAKAGVTQSASFRSIASQANDAAYASGYKLEATATAGPAGDLLEFLQFLQLLPPSPMLFTVASPLATSPVGSFVISDPSGGSSATPVQPATVTAGTSSELGEQATFTVTLSPVRYIGDYVVEGVEIYWLRPDGSGGMTLQPNRPGCNNLSATDGQTVFTCQTDFTVEHLGQQTFYAFVRASLFGVSLPFLLETANNSAQTLEVTSGAFNLIEVAKGTNVAGVDLSADGNTVVGIMFPPFPAGFDCAATGRCGFRWTSATGGVPLNPGTANFQEIIPMRISADGSTIVGAFVNSADEVLAFRDLSSDGFQVLPDLGGDNNGANGVSSDGSVIVGFVASADGLERLAARWTGGQIATLGPFGDATAVLAEAVADAGSPIVGNSSAGAFRWTSGSGYEALALGETASVAAISGDGSAIVGSRQASFDSGVTAFVLVDGVVRDLGLSGSSFSAATDVSTDGSVVVGFSTVPLATGGIEKGGGGPSNRDVAWRWTAATGTQTLTEWYEDSERQFPRLIDSVALAVSGDGQTVLAELEFEPGQEVDGAGLYLVSPSR